MGRPTRSNVNAGYRLERRLRVLVGLLVGLVVLAGVGTVSSAFASRRAVREAHAMQLESRRAALISVVVRELYIHEAHTIILRNHTHLAHHDEWVHRLESDLDALRGQVDDDGRAKVEEIREGSVALLAVFSAEILPASDRGDLETVRASNERANAIVDRMTHLADALSQSLEQRALEAELEAERIARLSIIGAAILALVAASLATFAGRSLWRAFSVPLAELERIATLVIAGDRKARLAPFGARELKPVGEGFNRMLDALGHAESELVAAERLAAIGRVAAGVAHEINNPIAVIRGYVKTMKEDAPTESLRDELSIIDEEALACQRIAEDLLLYSHSRGIVPVASEASEVLRDAVARCDDALGTSAREVSPVSVESEPALIAVDALRIRQVVINLVKNAREASDVSSRVEVVGHCDGDGYQIEVLDRGRGLSEEARAHLFEPFFTTRNDGTGLGLAVCQGLIAAHGGTIRAEARDGGGTRIVVALPGILVEGDTARSEPSMPATAQSEKRGATGRDIGGAQ